MFAFPEQSRRCRGARARRRLGLACAAALCCALTVAPAYASAPGPGTLDGLAEDGSAATGVEAGEYGSAASVSDVGQAGEAVAAPDAASDVDGVEAASGASAKKAEARSSSEGGADEGAASASDAPKAAVQDDATYAALVKQTGAWLALHDQGALERARAEVGSAGADSGAGSASWLITGDWSLVAGAVAVACAAAAVATLVASRRMVPAIAAYPQASRR